MKKTKLVVFVLLSFMWTFSSQAQNKTKANSKKSWIKSVAKGEPIYATLETSMGNMVVRLFSKETPRTVENFVGLASGGKKWVHPQTQKESSLPLYNGTTFHRVIPDFMIQGGDPGGTGRDGPGYKFADEFHNNLVFDRPCLMAMANSGPNTNGSQFFITEKATPWLNRRHTIFGEVIQGCELVGKIARNSSSKVTIHRINLAHKAPPKNR